MTARLVVLVSGNGTNLQAILDACESGRLDAKVVSVVSNKADAHGLRRAATAGIRTVVCAPNPGEERSAYDERLARVVVRSSPDLVVLAGWMRLLSMSFLQRFPGIVVNLHPALPGEFPGTHAIERAFARAQEGGPARTGVMVHLVPDEGIDDGPVIAVAEVPILPDDTLDALERRVHAVEHSLLVDALRTLTKEQADVPRP